MFFLICIYDCIGFFSVLVGLSMGWFSMWVYVENGWYLRVVLKRAVRENFFNGKSFEYCIWFGVRMCWLVG